MEAKQFDSETNVIVVGSGFSGLAAARMLRKRSCKVIVLESRDRIGGRVHTDYSLGFPVDVGASWLHGLSPENPLTPLISTLKLPLYKTSGDNSVLYDHDLESYALFEEGGKRVPQKSVEKVGLIFEKILEYTNEMRKHISKDTSFGHVVEKVLETYPEFKLEDLEKRVLKWYFCRLEGWFAAEMDELSVKHWDSEVLLDGGHGIMVNGYGPVLQSLAVCLDIRFNHRVVSVNKAENGVIIRTENNKSFFSNTVVLTVPIGVLKSGTVSFSPPLPHWKQSAIEDLGVGNENKIVLLFKNVFWPNVEFLGLVESTTYECAYFLNLHKATGHPVLIFMPAGDLAVDIEKKSNEEVSAFVMEQLRKILPNSPPPLSFLVTRWSSDPNSKGCYSFDKVGKPSDTYDRLRYPVPPLFFAGEATSRDFPGTVHGAYKTGVQAAMECYRYLCRQDHLAKSSFLQLNEVNAEDNGSLVLQVSRM